MNIASFKDYILLHNGDFYCEASDTVFDAVVVVDCSVVQEHDTIDIGAGEEFPNMDRFFNAFAERVRITEVKNGIPIIDISGWLDHNRQKVLTWIDENWNGGWCEDDWDDIKYQMIQEISNGIAGYKGNKAYGRYADLFESMSMTPAVTDDYTVSKDILGLWEQTVCEIRSEIKSWDLIGPHTKQYAEGLCNKLEHSMCASAGNKKYRLKYTLESGDDEPSLIRDPSGQMLFG